MAATADLAPIERGVSYPLPLFMKRVGLGRHGLREARKAGLRVVYAHGHAFVTGDAWLDYLESRPASDTSAA